jgi:hypothetical protein
VFCVGGRGSGAESGSHCVAIDGEGVQVEFGYGARHGDGSRRVERRELGDFIVVMFGGLAMMPGQGVGWAAVEVRHCGGERERVREGVVIRTVVRATYGNCSARKRSSR